MAAAYEYDDGEYDERRSPGRDYDDQPARRESPRAHAHFQRQRHDREEFVEEVYVQRRSSSENRGHSGRSYHPGRREEPSYLIVVDHDHYDNWKKPVVFEPDEPVYHPRQWLEKVEVLEAQIVNQSDEPLDRSLSHEPGYARAELRRLLGILRRVRTNTYVLQHSRFSAWSLNILAVDRRRPRVARLLEVPFTEIRDFVTHAERFIEQRGSQNRHWSLHFLRYCADYLAYLGLELHTFSKWKHDGRLLTERRDRDDLSRSLVYAVRAVTYVLDLAIASFTGAHLEPFDQVYFPHGTSHPYVVRCGDPKTKCELHSDGHPDNGDNVLVRHTKGIRPDRHEIYDTLGFRIHDGFDWGPTDHTYYHVADFPAILLRRRHFDCLNGFLAGHPAWVFESHDHLPDLRADTEPRPEMYLHTTPEQLANVWGPLWRAYPPHRGGTSRFVLSHGFIVPWSSTPRDPELLPGEHLCHWVQDVGAAGEALGFPRYINIRSLLIGAHPPLEENTHCLTRSKDVKDELGPWMRTLCTKDSRFLWGHLVLNASAGVPYVPGLLSFGASSELKRRRGVYHRDIVFSDLIAKTFQYSWPLSKLYGVEVSGCTGNARRRPLRELLVGRSVRELVKSTHDSECSDSKWRRYKQVLFAANYQRDVVDKFPPEELQVFREFLKLSISKLKELEVGSARHHVQALYGHHKEAFAVTLATRHCQWLRLFGDDMESLSAPIIEADCLECELGRLLCHRLHPSRPIPQAGSVLSTSVYLVSRAPLPKGLESYRSTGHLTPDMIRRVPAGEELDLGPHGTLRVLAHVRIADSRGYALVVQWRSPFVRAARSLMNFCRKKENQISREYCHHERSGSDELHHQCAPVLVVSDPTDEQISHWLGH